MGELVGFGAAKKIDTENKQLMEELKIALDDYDILSDWEEAFCESLLKTITAKPLYELSSAQLDAWRKIRRKMEKEGFVS